MKIRDDVIEELRNLIEYLESHNIEYILSGSLAMNTHMVPRFTRDVDIVIDLKKEMTDIFFAHFKDKFYLNEKEALKQIDNYGFFNALSKSTGYKYDFIVQRNTEFEKIKFERKKRKRIFEVEAWIISFEDLILSKLNWMQQTESIMQKNDIIALLEEGKPDSAYLNNWAKKLNLKTFDLF